MTKDKQIQELEKRLQYTTERLQYMIESCNWYFEQLKIKDAQIEEERRLFGYIDRGPIMPEIPNWTIHKTSPYETKQ